MLKEGIYEDIERRDALLALARFKTTAGNDRWRSLKDYVAALKENQTAIYYSPATTSIASRPRPSWRASAPAASRFCCLRTRSTASGSRPG